MILRPELLDLPGGNNSIRGDSTDLGYCQFRMQAKYVLKLVHYAALSLLVLLEVSTLTVSNVLIY